MKAKRGPGRPERLPSERREVFALRLTRDERALIERAAARAGEPVSRWVRDAILAAAVAAG